MNRKSLMASTVLTLLVLTAWSTAATAGKGYFGFQGGVVFANMGGDMNLVGDALAAELGDEFGGVWTAEKKGRTGFAAGLTYTLPYTSTFGFQFEALYASRGARFSMATGGVQATAQLKFNYLEIPVMLRWAPMPTEKKQIVLMLGPDIGFKMSPKLAVSGGGIAEGAGDLEHVTSTVFGLNGVVSFRFTTGEKSALQLQARYHWGLSNAIDDDEFSTKAQDFMLMAGMEFALGK